MHIADEVVVKLFPLNIKKKVINLSLESLASEIKKRMGGDQYVFNKTQAAFCGRLFGITIRRYTKEF